MNKETTSKIRGARLALLIGLITVMLVSYGYVGLQTDKNGFITIKFGGNLASANETDPAAGVSSMLEIYIVNHSAAPATAFNGTAANNWVHNNTMETWATTNMDADGAGAVYYAWSYFTGASGQVNIGFGQTMTIKWGTTFDIIVKIRGNTTVCGNGAAFVPYGIKMRINTTGGVVLASQWASGWGFASNDSTYSASHFLYLHFYWNNGGAGFTLPKGSTITITNIKLYFTY